jgi:hypothetical protein
MKTKSMKIFAYMYGDVVFADFNEVTQTINDLTYEWRKEGELEMDLGTIYAGIFEGVRDKNGWYVGTFTALKDHRKFHVTEGRALEVVAS